MWRKVGYTRVGPVSMWIHSVWGGVLACAAHTPHSDVPWDPRPQSGQPRCHGRFMLLDFPHNKGSCTGEGGRPRGPNRLSQFSPGYGLFWKGQSPTVLRPLVAFHMPSLAGIIRLKSGAPIQSGSPESPIPDEHSQLKLMSPCWPSLGTFSPSRSVLSTATEESSFLPTQSRN